MAIAPALTFAGLLAAIARRKSRQTAALYAHLVATRGAGTPPFTVDLAELTAELAARHADTDLFTRDGPHWGAHWHVAAGLWELRYLGLSWPALARPVARSGWLSGWTIEPWCRGRTRARRACASARCRTVTRGPAWCWRRSNGRTHRPAESGAAMSYTPIVKPR